jgi:hypothetical protein
MARHDRTSRRVRVRPVIRPERARSPSLEGVWRTAVGAVHLPKAPLDLLDSGQKDAFNAAMAKAQASADSKAARRLAFRSKP